MRIITYVTVLLLGPLFFAGCTQHVPVPATTAVTTLPLTSTKTEASTALTTWVQQTTDVLLIKAEWPEEWTAAVSGQLKDDATDFTKLPAPRDWAAFCTQPYEKIEKRGFYIALLSALAKFESGYKAEAKYQENFKDVAGKYIISRGPLQLSKESANSPRYKCGIGKEEELHDVGTNLRCGAKILYYWVKNDGRITGGGDGAWLGAARYWSPFRSSAKLAAIQLKTKDYCSVVATAQGGT